MFLGLVVLTVLFCTVIYAVVVYRYLNMLKLSGIYHTEQGKHPTPLLHQAEATLHCNVPALIRVSCSGQSFKLEMKVPAYILSFIICWGPALATNMVEAFDVGETKV